MAEGRSRPAWAEIDLEAVRVNIGLMSQVAAPAAVCAVVKADGYGHGAVTVAHAAIELPLVTRLFVTPGPPPRPPSSTG